jgi:putative transposase
MGKTVQIARRKDKEQILSFLQKEGQMLLPILELVETNRIALDELIDVTGRAVIEMILTLSAEALAGEKQRGRPGEAIRWHGTQGGVVHLSNRKIRVSKPRLRRKGGGEGAEVAIPAYEAMQDYDLGQRMMEILLRGVSTRTYARVLPEMASSVGIEKSSVSRKAIVAGEKTLKAFCERRWDDEDLLVIYVDGVRVGDYHVIVALGVDSKGSKHVLGIREGATENATVVKDLLVDLVERGVKPDRRRLFVIDGSKALRKAINEVFGPKNPVQRCRKHKEQNVLGYLPEEQKDKTRWVMRAAFKLDADKGMRKLEEHAEWLQRTHPSAAASLREGLEEMFTINRLDLSPPLRRCLGTTNIIENPNSGMRQRTGNVKRWRDGQMVLRWMASAYLDTETSFRKIMGHKDLWMLDAALKDQEQKKRDSRKEVA